VNISLTVRACILGEVQQSPTQCMRCPLPQYSYNTLNHTCDSPCPRNANCTGGAVVVPLEGFWVSARISDSMVACPVGQACQGDRAALQACLSAESTTLDNAEQQQVRAGMSNNLSCAFLHCVCISSQFCFVIWKLGRQVLRWHSTSGNTTSHYQTACLKACCRL